eukprot:7090850-Pyramimonas_sp.AAC.1
MLRTSSRFPGRHVYRTLRNLWSRGSPGAPAAHHGETQELLTHYLLSYCVALVRFLLGLLNRSFANSLVRLCARMQMRRRWQRCGRRWTRRARKS